jgi:hypothetical protein
MAHFRETGQVSVTSKVNDGQDYIVNMSSLQVQSRKIHSLCTEEKEVQEELLDCAAVPPRSSQKLRIQLRHGARLQPLPYPLDEKIRDVGTVLASGR